MLLDDVARPLATALLRPTVIGESVLEPISGPVIFAANHASHLDTTLLLSVLPARFRHRIVVAGAADYFFDRRWKATLWAGAVSVVPMERVRVSRRSAELAAELIGQGWSLLIFPEGGRSPDGWGQEFKGGAAYLAKRCGVPVVPVHLAGTRAVLGKGSRALRPGPTEVRFHRALVPGDDSSTPEHARQLAERIEHAVSVLADEAASDWWSATKRSAAGTTPSLSGPPVASWRRAWALPKGATANARGTNRAKPLPASDRWRGATAPGRRD